MIPRSRKQGLCCMKNEVIIQKIVSYVEKILTYTAGMEYKDFKIVIPTR